MPRKTDPTDRIVDAALSLIAERGWRATQLHDIAARAKVDLAAVYRAFDGKAAILDAFSRRVDGAMLAGATPGDPNETAHDLLFDAIMRRFDALGAHKPAMLVLAREWRGQPLALLAQTPALMRSMRWALEAAGIPADGIQGAVLVRGLACAWGATARIWLGDDSPDAGRTMAALDKNLRRLARLSPMLRSRSDPAGSGAGEAAAAPA